MKKGLVSKSKEEFKIAQELKVLFRELNFGMWKAAGILWAVRERKGWKALGHQSFEEYCESELDRNVATMNNLLRAYEVAILKYQYKVSELPYYSKVAMIADILEENPAQKDEWMERARQLTSFDLRKIKNEFKFGEENKCSQWEIQVIERCVAGSKESRRRYDLEKQLAKLLENGRDPKSR